MALVLSSLPIGAGGQTAFNNGLVAYYPFDGNADDLSGNGNNLTNYDATLCAGQFGDLNHADHFDGTSYLGSSVSPLSQIDNWTVTAWIKPGSLSQSTAYAVCVGYDNAEQGNGYALGVSDNDQLWAFYPGVGFFATSYTFSSTNQWCQIAMLRSSGSLSLYVNGEFITNATSVDPLEPSSFEVGTGGATGEHPNRYFIGAVGDVRVYNVPLTASEVQQLYNYEATNAPLLYFSSVPTNEVVDASSTVSFTTEGFSGVPLQYQWFFDGASVADATNATLSLRNVQTDQAGSYSVVISNSYGSLTSPNAILTVLTFTDGVVAYYPFNGNANDLSGNGNNLTNYGATLCADRFGNSNQAYYFNGSSYLGSSVSPLTQTDNWTVSAWIQLASLSGSGNGCAVCVGYDSGFSGDGFALGVSGGDELYGFFAGMGFIPEAYTFSSINQWYQVTMVRSSGTLTMYVDGDPITNNAPTAYAPITPTSFEVGGGGPPQYYGFPAPYFWGAVDDVRVYNRPLAASEVEQLYNYEAFNSLLPVIVSQPTNVTGSVGEDVFFSVIAGGVGPLIYQWSYDDAIISAATNSTLELTDLQFTQTGTYTVMISNTYGSVSSSNSVLTVVGLPVIESQPQAEAVVAGTGVEFSVTASSSSPLRYQWTFGGNNISAATSSALSLTDVQSEQSGTYAVVISNSYGSVTSASVLLTVLSPQVVLNDGLAAYYPFNGNTDDESGNGNDLTNFGATLCEDRFGNPNSAYFFNGSSYLISANSPVSQTDNWTVTAWIKPSSIPQTTGYAVCVGYDNGSSGDGYALGVSGGEVWGFYPGVELIPYDYMLLSTNQWHQVVLTRSSGSLMMYVDGNAITNGGPTTNSPAAPTSIEVGSGGSDRYFEGAVDDVRVYNVPLTALEAHALYNYEITMPPLPIIQSQPTDQMVDIRDTAVFAVGAVGAGPLLYQWTFNGTNIAEATNSALTLTDVLPAQMGTYSVVVGDSSGSVTSVGAVLSIVNFPIIEVQPQSQGVLTGGDAMLTVTASGTGLTYQWFMDNSPLAGATSSTLVLNDINASASGAYTVVISNDVWAVTSSVANLSVISGAAILDPPSFTSLGVFDPVTNVLVDVGSGQISGGASFKGTNITQAGTSILVFTFSNFVLDSGLSITFTNGANNSTAVAFLSQGNMTIGGVIDANGQGAPNSIGIGPGGPDGNGPGAGSSGPSNGGGSGGGFGGAGAAGYLGSPGGGTYNPDLTAGIVGGSPGGSGGGEFAGGGGGGGGALQLGALGSLVVTGAVLANGSVGSACVPPFVGGVGSGGGGSGGGILIQAADVIVSAGATISANGGSGGSIALGQDDYNYGGGGGGGGRIVVAFQQYCTNNGTITALGAESGYLDTAIGANGTVVSTRVASLPFVPTISASVLSPGQLTLSWPLSATNYILQTSPTLNPDAVWTYVTGAVVSGNNLMLTNRISGTTGFFRLVRQ